MYKKIYRGQKGYNLPRKQRIQDRQRYFKNADKNQKQQEEEPLIKKKVKITINGGNTTNET